MDFSLNEEQRNWQQKARVFAKDEIRPISIQRDQMEGGFAPWNWDIIEMGSKLGFRTLAVPKKWGGPGTDFVTQALVMMELAKGDSAICKAFSQNWKWSHLIASACNEDQKDRFLKPFIADDRYLIGRGITEPNAGCDNRLPPKDDPKAGYKLHAERDGDDWILNGEKCFIANGSVGSLFFVDARTDPNVNITQGGTLFLVPKETPGFRVGKIFNKRGWRFYQNAELIFENARVPHVNVIGSVGTGSVKAGGGDTTGGDLFGAKGTMWANTAISKSFMEESLEISLGIDNLFDMGGFQMKRNKPLLGTFDDDGNEYENEFTEIYTRRGGRTFKLNIIYRFGNMQDEKRRGRHSDHGDEGSMDMGY